MENQIIDAVIILLIALVFFLVIKRNHQNKFHLDYIIIHTVLLLSATSLFKGIQFYNIGSVFFDLINILHISSFVFLILHVCSAIQGYKKEISYLFFIPLILYTLIIILNYFEVYLLNYKTVKSNILLLKINNPVYFSDKVFVKSIVSISLFIYLLRICLKEIRISNRIKKIQLYEIWIYSYLFVLIETILITSCYYFNIINPVFDEGIQLIILINSILSLIFFIFNPVLFSYFPLLKKVDIIEQFLIEETYSKIENLMKNEKAYLKRRLTIYDIMAHTGCNKLKVQKAILTNTKLNFNDFVNSYRVNRVVELIEKGYLINKNLKSLSEDAGFNSPQTFYRAFKKIKGVTPTKYWTKIRVLKLKEAKK